VDEFEAKILEITKQLDESSTKNDGYFTRVQNLTQQLENLMVDELLNANSLLGAVYTYKYAL
jgi:hypothetical protein